MSSAINTLGTPEPDMLLLGDFNFQGAVWREGIGLQQKGRSSETSSLNGLLDLCDALN